MTTIKKEPETPAKRRCLNTGLLVPKAEQTSPSAGAAENSPGWASRMLLRRLQQPALGKVTSNSRSWRSAYLRRRRPCRHDLRCHSLPVRMSAPRRHCLVPTNRQRRQNTPTVARLQPLRLDQVTWLQQLHLGVTPAALCRAALTRRKKGPLLMQKRSTTNSPSKKSI